MSTYTFVNDGRILRVTMEGSVDLSISPSLKTDVEQLISSDTLAVHLLASDVTYIDSSGVASLLFIKKLIKMFALRFLALAVLLGVLNAFRGAAVTSRSSLSMALADYRAELAATAAAIAAPGKSRHEDACNT